MKHSYLYTISWILKSIQIPFAYFNNPRRAHLHLNGMKKKTGFLLARVYNIANTNLSSSTFLPSITEHYTAQNQIIRLVRVLMRSYNDVLSFFITLPYSFAYYNITNGYFFGILHTSITRLYALRALRR